MPVISAPVPLASSDVPGIVRIGDGLTVNSGLIAVIPGAPNGAPVELRVSGGEVQWRSTLGPADTRFWVSGQAVYSYGVIVRSETVNNGSGVSKFVIQSGAGFGMNIGVMTGEIVTLVLPTVPPTISYSSTEGLTWRITDINGWNMQTVLPSTGGVMSTITLGWESFVNTGYQTNVGTPPNTPGASKKYEFIPKVAPATVQLAFMSPATGWTNLIALSELTGAPGADGRKVELQKSGTHVQWRLAGDAVWTDLVALSDITGPAGTGGGVISGAYSVADDSVRSFKVGSGAAGFACIWFEGAGGPKPASEFMFLAGASPIFYAVNQGDFGMLTGTPTGTTGSDGSISLFVNNGYLFIENRVGYPATIKLFVSVPEIS